MGVAQSFTGSSHQILGAVLCANPLAHRHSAKVPILIDVSWVCSARRPATR